METSDCIRFGVLGCANIADIAVVPALNMCPLSFPYAIASRNRDKANAFKEKHGFTKIHDTYEELLLDKNVDAVYIPLPNSLHKEWVIKALMANKHVLCEKPLGISPSEVKEMIDLAQRKGLLIMEAYGSRFNPINEKIKVLIDDGSIGRLRYIESHLTFPMEDQGNIRLNKSLAGGATYDVGSYNINLMNYLVGKKVESVKAHGLLDTNTGVDMASIAILRYENDVIGVSNCGFNTKVRCELTLVGSDGSMHVPTAYYGKGIQEIHVNSDGVEQIHEVYSDDNYLLEVRHFSECILENKSSWLMEEDCISNAGIIEDILCEIGYLAE